MTKHGPRRRRAARRHYSRSWKPNTVFCSISQIGVQFYSKISIFLVFPMLLVTIKAVMDQFEWIDLRTRLRVVYLFEHRRAYLPFHTPSLPYVQTPHLLI